MNPHRHPSRQHGAAAVELAFVFVAVWIMLAVVWVLGQLSFQRSLIRASVRDAAMLVASATPAELAVPGAAEALEARAEAALRAVVESGGNEVLDIDITRYAINNYGPALSRVLVTANVNILESVFPNYAIFGGLSETITVEVPYGSRIAGP